MSDDSPTPDLSIVVPMHDEADNVRPLHNRLVAVLDGLNKSVEVVYIDDGSRDATFDRLQAVFDSDDRVRVLKLRANYGLTTALRAGIEAARGSVIVTLDGDLQNDPADIPKLLDKLEEGYDLVCGWRKQRQDRFWAKRLPSILGNWFAKFWLVMPVHDTGCTLKAMRADLAKRLPLRRGYHRFIPSLATIFEARTTEVVVQHHSRTAGRSKYNWSRTVDVLADMIVLSFLIAGLRPQSPMLSWDTLSKLAWIALVGGIAYWILDGAGRLSIPVVFMAIALGNFVFTMQSLKANRDNFLSWKPKWRRTFAPNPFGRLFGLIHRLIILLSLAGFVLGTATCLAEVILHWIILAENASLGNAYLVAAVAALMFISGVGIEISSLFTFPWRVDSVLMELRRLDRPQLVAQS